MPFIPFFTLALLQSAKSLVIWLTIQAWVPSLLSRVRLFVISWTVAHQAPLSMGLSRQEYQSGLPFPPPGVLPDLGIKPVSSASSALAGRLFTSKCHQILYIPLISLWHISISYVLVCLLVCVYVGLLMYIHKFLHCLILFLCCAGRGVCTLTKLTVPFSNFGDLLFLSCYLVNHRQVVKPTRSLMMAKILCFQGYIYIFQSVFFAFFPKILDFSMVIWLLTWLALYLRFICNYSSDLMCR